jgi:hypothetical protein
MDSSAIGETAGRIWKQLSRSGAMSLNELTKEKGAESRLALLAIGWLCREDKLAFEIKGREIVVKLKDSEMHHVQA